LEVYAALVRLKPLQAASDNGGTAVAAIRELFQFRHDGFGGDRSELGKQGSFGVQFAGWNRLCIKAQSVCHGLIIAGFDMRSKLR
jgi:hypothetical protein